MLLRRSEYLAIDGKVFKHAVKVKDVRFLDFMENEAMELRSVNFKAARWLLRNSNSAGCRGQNASDSVTVRSSLFLTERIWPSWLVQNWSAFMGKG